MRTAERPTSPVRLRRRSGFGLPLIRDLLITARPLQWQKNLLLFAAFVFSAGAAWSPEAPAEWIAMLGLATAGFLLFNAVASGEYMINDALDVEQDRRHPRKRLRPIAAGRVSVGTAVAVGLGLMLGGVYLAFLLRVEFGLATLGYGAVTLAYSLVLKHLVIVDVVTVASGFALRAVAGAIVIAVPISPWLYVCTISGALFIAVAKRRQEVRLLGGDAAHHRRVLGEYTTEFLDQMWSVAAAATIVSYALYSVTAENVPANDSMLITLPFVLYGIFRYRLITERSPERNADELIASDVPLLVSVVLFALTALAVLVLDR